LEGVPGIPAVGAATVPATSGRRRASRGRLPEGPYPSDARREAATGTGQDVIDPTWHLLPA